MPDVNPGRSLRLRSAFRLIGLLLDEFGVLGVGLGLRDLHELPGQFAEHAERVGIGGRWVGRWRLVHAGILPERRSMSVGGKKS